MSVRLTRLRIWLILALVALASAALLTFAALTKDKWMRLIKTLSTTTHWIKTNAKPPPEIKRILWWSTVYGSPPAFFGIANTPEDLQKLARVCKSRCEFVVDRNLLNVSHAVIFHGWPEDLPVRTIRKDNKSVLIPTNVSYPRDPDQFYIYMTFEPFSRIWKNMEAYEEFFNWTMTYSSDSNFVAKYGQIVPKTEEELKQEEHLPTAEDLAVKKDLVACMVSNCDDAPSGRGKLVEELQKHFPVHVYGKCGYLSCDKERDECYQELGKTHKFYLSFENALCKDYVTEKFFSALEAKMVPVVYGKANYGLRFPPGSFINVDAFPSAKALAHYLLWLDQNDEEYLKYFEWRKTHRIDASWYLEQLYCSACEKLHEDYGVRRSVVNINEWLRRDPKNESVCTEPQGFF